MPSCKKCNNTFPYTTIIDGKERNLGNRKYCLDCSPFGLRNTVRLEKLYSNENSKLRHCIKCDRDFLLDKSKGQCGDTCNSCRVNFRRFKNKQILIDYKGGHCVVCGYDKCNASMVFH